MKRLFVAALLIGLLPASTLLGQPPTLSHLATAGLRPGQTADIVLHGANLAGATSVWSSLPLSTELTPGLEGNGAQPASVSFRFKVPPEAPLGVAGLRVITGNGVSNLRLVLVDDLASVAKSGDNKSLDKAQVLVPPIAVDGACDAEASDFYKITATSGQRLSFEVFARRLGSPLDPMIRLLAADGRELAFSDDEPGSGADGRLSHTFESPGDYYLEVRDIRFQGGGGHRYRLRLGDFPLPAVAYPVAVQKGTTASVELAGKHADLPGPVSVSVPAEVPGNRVQVAASRAAGQGSSWVTLLASDTVEQLEQEPNDAPAQSTAVKLPGAIDGRLATPGDRDFYQFEAKKGERLLLAGQTRSLGSPCDLFLRIYNADGGVLAEAEDTGGDEGTLDFSVPADGTYRLGVEEVGRGGAPDKVYRIAVEPYQAGFTLAAASEKVDAPQNGVFVVKVTATRRDYNGPITLAIEGAGDGSTLRHNIIPEGKPETTLNFTLGPSLTAGQLVALKIVGTAKVGAVDFRATASTLVALRGAMSGLPYPPAVFDGSLALGVGPVFPPFFQLAASSPVVALVEPGKPAKLQVQLTRTNGFDDKVNLAIEGLPKPAAAAAAAIEKGKTDAAIELTAPEVIPPGKHKVRLVGSATFQNQPQRFVVEDVTIEGPPVAVAFAPAGPVTAGGKQKGVLSFAGDVAPVAPAANYGGGVTRAAEGPRGPAMQGFEADNKAAAFSGVDKSPGDDRLTATLPLAPTSDYSVEFWIYNTRDLSLANSPAISGYVFSRPGAPAAGNAQPGDHLGIGGVESSPRDRLFFYNGQTMVAGRTPLAINAWHHVGLVRSGDEVRVYLNGEVATPEIHVTAPRNYDSNQICFGTRSDGYAPFQGRLDEITAYDAPLAAAQIQAHFAAAKAASPARDVVLKDNPLAYWRLDEAEGPLAVSVAPPHKRLVKLAWKDLPAEVTLPNFVVLVDGQNKVELELAAAAAANPAKLEKVFVSGTTLVAGLDFTAQSPPFVLEVTKP